MNKEKIDNREEIRKNRWLNHKTKFMELSYDSLNTDPFMSTDYSHFMTVEEVKNTAEHLEMAEEILEIGVLYRTLILEKTGDKLERNFSNLERVISALGNAQTQSGGVITEHRGAELLMHNYKGLSKEERSFLPPKERSPFKSNAVNLEDFVSTLEYYIRIKDEIEVWTNALKIHQQEEVA